MLATMSGYLGYRAIEDFIAKHRDDLLRIFKPPKDYVPSYSTVRRILMAIDFEQFVQIYKSWLSECWPTQNHGDLSNWYGVDGKAMRGTIVDENANDYVHLVSIFSAFDEIVLDAGKVQGKSNEIPLVQKLIHQSNLKNVIFTIDAMHCQRKTVETIIDSENDYVIAVKKNQPELYRQIETTIDENDPIDSDYTLEKNRGRKEERAVFIYDDLQQIDPVWKGLKRIIKVERKTQKLKTQAIHEETAYYIASIDNNAIEINRGIRAHWHIENKLHWTKDVVLKEDANKTKAENAPENLSIIRNWVMTVFRKNKYKSMTKAIRSVANDIPKMVTVLC